VNVKREGTGGVELAANLTENIQPCYILQTGAAFDCAKETVLIKNSVENGGSQPERS
jgi:hypothetical protein